jgi:hypothetical protein
MTTLPDIFDLPSADLGGLADVEAKLGQLGRHFEKTPAWLTRTMYLPKHNSDITHLPIYEVGKEYRETVGDLAIGSSLFKVKLHMMKKPSGNGTDGGDVQYLADFVPGSMAAGLVRRRALRQPSTEMNL